MDGSQKNKIIITGALIIFAIIYVLFALILGGKNPTNNINKKYLMINNYLLWQKQGNNWVQIKEIPEKFYDNVFTLYYGTEKQDNVIVQNANDVLYYFDKDYNQLKFENIKAVTTNLNLKFADYEIENDDAEDQTYITKALETTEATVQGNYNTKKIILDFDNDGILETLYVTTNFEFDNVDYDFSSIFYMVKNNVITQIIASDEMPYDFVSVLDIDNDDSYEVIMSYNVKNLPSLGSCYLLYDYNGDSWNLIKNCS